MAQAPKPWSAMRRKPCCSSTGSGVVRPVNSMRASAPSLGEPETPVVGGGGSPMPSVPTTPQRVPSCVRHCAVHQAVEVLPLVPVVATTRSAPLGWR
jgi:hypothetical protein